MKHSRPYRPGNRLVTLVAGGLAMWLSTRQAIAATTTARSVALAEELAAARTHELYLVFDPKGPALALKVEGVLLRRFAVDRAEFLEPRWSTGPGEWPAPSFTLATEIGERRRARVQIQDAADSAEADPVQTVAQERAEPRTAFPASYRLRFSPDLVLVVRGGEGMGWSSGFAWLGGTVVEGWKTLFDGLSGRPFPARLVLHLEAGDARRLFQALVPGIRLVVAGLPSGPPPVFAGGGPSGIGHAPAISESTGIGSEIAAVDSVLADSARVSADSAGSTSEESPPAGGVEWLAPGDSIGALLDSTKTLPGDDAGNQRQSLPVFPETDHVTPDTTAPRTPFIRSPD